LRLASLKKTQENPLKDIAARLGVGISTVSAVLNGKEYCYVSAKKKKLIIDTARELGYVPNQMSRGMQGLSTKTIGIIGSLFSVPIVSELVEAMNKRIAKAGYSTLLGDSYSQKDDEERIIREFLARGVDGLLINSTYDVAELDELLKERVPYVSFNKDFDGLSVTMDREAGAFQAVDHLMEKHGRRTVAFVAKGLRTNPCKLAGYRGALEKHGLSFKEEHCFEMDALEGYAELVELLSRGGFDAVLASNDVVAGMILKHLKKTGARVPEDVSIIGFDGIKHICELTDPPLRSVKDPTAKVAEKSVDLLLRRLNGETLERKRYIIAPEWFPGESCGCCKDEV
jgi:DNA-binding LacI/PurR family transcriptional regulator